MDNTTEIWTPILGTYELYEISNFGNVKSVRYNKILKPGIAGSGYKQVRMSIGSKPCSEYVHRLVATHFLTEVNGKNRVNHKDLNKLNNHVDNLEFMTQRENVHHFYLSNGIKPREMRKIVAFDLEGNQLAEYLSINDAAKAYGVSPETVHNRVKNKVNKNRKSRIPYDFQFK